MSADIETADRFGREESRLQTRRRLLEAARKVFLKTGYQGAKLDDIVAAAGFTKGALYWHFPNKQALFLALVRDSIESNLGRFDRLLELGKADPQALKRELGEWIDRIDRYETLPSFGAELEIESRHDPSFRAIHQQMIAEHESALAGFLQQYFELVDERPPMPVPELAASIITIFKGFALSRQNRPDHFTTSGKAVRLLLGLPVDR